MMNRRQFTKATSLNILAGAGVAGSLSGTEDGEITDIHQHIYFCNEIPDLKGSHRELEKWLNRGLS